MSRNLRRNLLDMHEFRHGSSPPTGSGRICLPAFDVMTSTLTMESPERALHDQFDQSLDALMEGDTLVITTLDRLGRSTQNMLAFADELRSRGAGLRVLNLGGGDADTATPMGPMLFTIMAALAQMEHEIKRESVTDSIIKRREAGKDLGGRPRRVIESQIRSAVHLVKGGEPAAQVARDLGMSRAPFYTRSRGLAD